jgi:hypothetical protein
MAAYQVDETNLPQPISLPRPSADISGRVFGKWTVLYPTKVDGSHNVLWLVVCSCGQHSVQRASYLKSGRSTQCRQCSNTIKVANKLGVDVSELDLTGRKFGEWSVIGLGTPATDGAKRWRAKCSCGVIDDVRGTSLRCGISTRCRCCAAKANLQRHQKLLGQQHKVGSHRHLLIKHNRLGLHRSAGSCGPSRTGRRRSRSRSSSSTTGRPSPSWTN